MAKGEKYAKLGEYLQKSSSQSITLSYEEIEKIINDKLPKSAYEHAEKWWSNCYYHSQAIPWIEVGYKTDSVSYTYKNEKITFIKVVY